MESTKGLALLEVHSGSGEPASRRVTFDGIALGPGVFVDAADRRIRIREEHLPLVAERVRGVFLRDLHREDLGASVGVVAAARVEAGEVRFTGDVRLAPYVELIRHFWPSIRFSLGFRYDPARLALNGDGTYDLPPDFLIDHLALVPQGQYPNARLVRLLNQARGLTPSSPPSSSLSGEHQRADGNGGLAPSLSGGTPMPEENPELNLLRQQRDDALKAAKAAEAASEAHLQAAKTAEAASEKSRRDLEAANRLAEAARLELGQAKNRVAAEVMKFELGAGKDFDLDQRKKELTGMDLAALDRLRGELRLAAAPADGDGGGNEPPGPITTPADAEARAPQASAQALDLQALGLNDTLRLALKQGVF